MAGHLLSVATVAVALLLTNNIASARGRHESRLRGPSKPPVQNAGELIEPSAFDRKTSETMPPSMREQVYRIYLEFLETAENKRRWNIFNDIPWDKLDVSKTTATTAQCVETFCAEE